MILRVLLMETSLSFGEKSGGPTKESGLDNRPTTKDSEKFSVARVARNMPSSSNEKH